MHHATNGKEVGVKHNTDARQCGRSQIDDVPSAGRRGGREGGGKEEGRRERGREEGNTGEPDQASEKAVNASVHVYCIYQWYQVVCSTLIEPV